MAIGSNVLWSWLDSVSRDGVPMQREAVVELIADLIFDCDCPGAELVLCLPLKAAYWSFAPCRCSPLTCRLILLRAPHLFAGVGGLGVFG